MYNRNIKENEDKASKFHAERIEAFDKLEEIVTEYEGEDPKSFK